MERNFFWSNKN